MSCAWAVTEFMSSVVKRAARYGGCCFALALISGKVLGPLIGQLQKKKTDEIISDERFKQACDNN